MSPLCQPDTFIKQPLKRTYVGRAMLLINVNLLAKRALKLISMYVLQSAFTARRYA